MLKYELVGEGNLFNPIETIFNNRGIINYKNFLDLDKTSEHDLHLLDNIDEAAELLIKHIRNNSKIFIQIDEDADGYCSSSILYNYLIRVGVQRELITWRVHGKKKHGIVVDTIPDDVDLLVIPDASSNQYDEHQALTKQGKEIIILDHHDAEKYSKNAIVVNNQLSKNYPNKNLSATGVVYKFLQLVDKKLGVRNAEIDMDLVAIGLVSDVMSTKEEETRYYIQQGLKEVTNPLIKEIIKLNKTYVDIDNLTIKGIAWTIAPRLNAVSRVASVTEREDMFKSMTLQEFSDDDVKQVAQSLEKIRERQNELRDKGEIIVQEIIDDGKLYNNHIIVVNTGEKVDEVSSLAPSLSGLIAVRFAQKYKKPTLVLREDDEGYLTGSGRGYENGIIKELKTFLNNSGQVVFAEGHENAHGVRFANQNKIDGLLEYTNDCVVVSDSDVEGAINLTIVDVDFIVNNVDLDYGLVSLIDSYKHAWGRNVEEPLFAIEKVFVERRNISIFGKNTTVMKFTSGNTEYIKFNVSEEEINTMRDGNRNERLQLTVIGTPEVNTFRGKTTAQVVMQDFKIESVSKQVYAF